MRNRRNCQRIATKTCKPHGGSSESILTTRPERHMLFPVLTYWFQIGSTLNFEATCSETRVRSSTHCLFREFLQHLVLRLSLRQYPIRTLTFAIEVIHLETFQDVVLHWTRDVWLEIEFPTITRQTIALVSPRMFSTLCC